MPHKAGRRNVAGMKAEQHTEAIAPGNGFYKIHRGSNARRKEKVIITENMNCINPSHPIPSEAKPPIESSVFTKRIGSTNYRVSVHFSKTSHETMNDKILRLMKNEAAKP